MKLKMLSVLSLSGVMMLAARAQANVGDFSFSGPGVSGSGTLTYTTMPDGTDPITGITGTFTDTNAGNNVVGATITGLHAVDPVPLPTGVTATNFSQYAVSGGVTGTSPMSYSLSYDNNFYGYGSPSVCSDYPFFGGNLDVYGLLFDISSGGKNYVVNLWSDGTPTGGVGAPYGLALADSSQSYDYVDGVTANLPEPGVFSLMGIALGGLVLIRRRKPAAA